MTKEVVMQAARKAKEAGRTRFCMDAACRDMQKVSISVEIRGVNQQSSYLLCCTFCSDVPESKLWCAIKKVDGSHVKRASEILPFSMISNGYKKIQSGKFFPPYESEDSKEVVSASVHITSSIATAPLVVSSKTISNFYRTIIFHPWHVAIDSNCIGWVQIHWHMEMVQPKNLITLAF